MSVRMNLQLRQISLYIKRAQLYTFSCKLFYIKSEYESSISQILEEKFKDVLLQPKIEKETWETVRKQIIGSRIDPSIVDSVFLSVLKQKTLTDAGISYYQFLIKNNYDLTITTHTYFLQFYETKETIEKADKEYILNLYEDLMSKYTSFEMNMSKALVVTLCRIDEWKKAIKVIEKFETNDRTFIRKAYSTLISYLYDCGEADKAYEYLLISFKKGPGPFEHTYTSYLKYHLKNKCTVNQKIEELFSLWSQYDIKPTKNTIQEYMAVCNDLGWSAKHTELEGLKCAVCEQELLQTLSDKDYQRLYKYLEKKLTLGDMYYLTNPKEIQKFIKFINASKPYDIIIDGLNFVYSGYNSAKTLQQNLIDFKNQGKKVLLIGRKHIKNLVLKLNLNKFTNYFLVDNISKDDLFILYAAFASGKNTKIISNDLMREHKFAIDDVELNALFKKWQMSQQCTLYKHIPSMKKLTNEIPIDAVIQKQLSCWHIPYVSNIYQQKLRHTSNTNWACFNMCP